MYSTCSVKYGSNWRVTIRISRPPRLPGCLILGTIRWSPWPNTYTTLFELTLDLSWSKLEVGVMVLSRSSKLSLLADKLNITLWHSPNILFITEHTHTHTHTRARAHTHTHVKMEIQDAGIPLGSHTYILDPWLYIGMLSPQIYIGPL